MATFKREWFSSVTNYVKANYLCGNNKEISVADLPSYEISGSGTGNVKLLSMTFDDKSSNFSKFEIGKLPNSSDYSTYICFNSIEDLDCKKLDFKPYKPDYTRLLDGALEGYSSQTKIIRNLTLKNFTSKYSFPIWGLDNLEELLNLKIENSALSIGNDNRTMAKVRQMTFAEGCTFTAVEFRGNIVCRKEPLINLFKALQTVTDTHICNIGSTNLALLTDEEKKIATDKGWTLA